VNAAVNISRDLELLGRLRARLAEVGICAEVRDHLMGLVIFPPAPALPVCVFVSGNGQFYSWDGGRRTKTVAHLAQAAAELAVVAERGAGSEPVGSGRGMKP
jgi:hypothetical protein